MLKLPQNQKGRDLVVGDIHGSFSFLNVCLARVRFDPRVDRLIAVGDLIDRGDESAKVINTLDQPWFFSVQGNHDAMPAAAIYAKEHGDDEIWHDWINHGGDWATRIDANQLKDISIRLAALPYAIEVTTLNGLVGVCHAEPHIGADWLSIRARLERGCEHTRRDLTWGRYRMNKLRKKGLTGLPHAEWSIAHADHIFCGHTVVDRWFTTGNLNFIDTGAAFENGALTLIDISIPGFMEHTFPLTNAPISKKEAD